MNTLYYLCRRSFLSSLHPHMKMPELWSQPIHQDYSMRISLGRYRHSWRATLPDRRTHRLRTIPYRPSLDERLQRLLFPCHCGLPLSSLLHMYYRHRIPPCIVRWRDRLRRVQWLWVRWRCRLVYHGHWTFLLWISPNSRTSSWTCRCLCRWAGRSWAHLRRSLRFWRRSILSAWINI